jgi:hypothetical protein
MKRKLMYGGVLVLGLSLLAVGVWLAPGLWAQNPAGSGPAREVRSDEPLQLPVSRVVLFNSGVGYFQREGSVTGNAQVDLTFPVRDINDLLKSMVLQDLDGGQIGLVRYDADAPLAHTLQSFQINLHGNPSLADLLTQARGRKVEVSLQSSNVAQPATLTGSIVGLETSKRIVDKETLTTTLLTLWCTDGLRRIDLKEVQRLRFLDAQLEGEFREALRALASSSDARRKGVTLHFSGEGKRRVRVGYVVENPIWKTSYRLVLDQEQAPYLQGWATVENATEEDWKDVGVVLVSGRPLSFRMDLYTPLYVPRPLVRPNLFASLVPPTYSGDLMHRPGEAREASDKAIEKPEEEASNRYRSLLESQKRVKRFTGSLRGEELRKANEQLDQLADEELHQRMELGQSVQSMASGVQLGESFQYAIAQPVSLNRQKSALLPILGQDIEAERVSIYNEGVQSEFALRGLRLENATDLHLMQGPITVFEGSTYAGDARLPDLKPHEKRLISYAVDLGCEVKPRQESSTGTLTQVKAVKGILHTTTKQRQVRSYTITNRNPEARTVIIEHPVRDPFTLVDTPKPAETTRDVYRFEVKVDASKTEKLTVTEEMDVGSSIQLASSNDQQIQVFLRSPIVSEAVKQGLQKALEMRHTLARTQREIQELQRRLNVIEKDQERLRANLKAMPSTAKAYKRYLDKFDVQEDEIEKLHTQIEKLEANRHLQQKAFDDFLVSFSAT